jgi:hypothetical protein
MAIVLTAEKDIYGWSGWTCGGGAWKVKGASKVKSMRLPGLTSTFAAERAAMMGSYREPGRKAVANRARQRQL